LHRAILLIIKRIKEIQDEINAFQAEVLSRYLKTYLRSKQARNEMTAEIFHTEIELTKSWYARIGKLQFKKKCIYYDVMLSKVNKQARLM